MSKRLFWMVLVGVACGMTLVSKAHCAELWVGAATVDITPAEPVALDGQRNARISKKPETPISATVLVLESREGAQKVEEAIIVSCDLVAIREGILEKVREQLKARKAEFDLGKVFLSATHTHTAPVTQDGKYDLPKTGIQQPGAYADWLAVKLADGISTAWQGRQQGKVAWGQAQAVIAQNRRAVYADGTAVMYGKTDAANFRGIEGYEDHNVDVLFFWDAKDRLIVTAVNVPCPAQEVGGRTSINADFWHPVREKLRERHGKDLQVLAWNGAGGDVTSRLMYGSAADDRMRKLRGNISRLDELGRRIVNAWEEAYEGAKKDIRRDVPLRHTVKTVDLPWRKVTQAEVDLAKKEAEKFSKDPAQLWNYRWNQGVVARHEAQAEQKEGMFQMELHALRLGDVAIASNPFELFTDYGVQMKARSPGIQTFVIQLAGSGGYLPTTRAVLGGGYSAVIQSSRVGPEGGQVLVEQTLVTWKELWKK
ncbi:MAG: hypothetical protein ACO1QS_00845 [Verrucomicrobiota bacterium]